jgi:hypothetical protein
MILLVSLRQEMLRLYPDAEATMGDGKVVGETGPDVAGKNLSPTTVKVCISCAEFILTLFYFLLETLFSKPTPYHTAIGF